MEAVVALTIIGLFAAALLSTTAAQLRTAGKANTLLVARSLAEDRLAALRLLEYDDLDDVPDSLRAGAFPPPFEGFAWTARVEALEEEYDLFGVEVTVEGHGETFPLRTLIHAPRPSTLAEGQTGAIGGGGRGGAPGGGRGGLGPAVGRGGAPGAGRGDFPGGQRGAAAGRGSTQTGGRGAQTGRGGRGGGS
jgi:type II secretory pathway pseudopilin PulG